MKIISFAAVKGGVGKTTLTFNFAEYLIGQGKKKYYWSIVTTKVV
ncbi:ParA family protein [Holzapfeliella floricola]|nr:ParA family protein [Holzapfeliella floricola]